MTVKHFCFMGCMVFISHQSVGAGDPLFNKIKKLLKENIIIQANEALTQQPITVTAEKCERSAGTIHDFYSEGDYWWSNPADPSLNIKKPGLTRKFICKTGIDRW